MNTLVGAEESEEAVEYSEAENRGKNRLGLFLTENVGGKTDEEHRNHNTVEVHILGFLKHKRKRVDCARRRNNKVERGSPAAVSVDNHTDEHSAVNAERNREVGVHIVN